MKKTNIEKNYNLSVIVPFYNEEKYLEESVLRLVDINIYEKIILVNDNSKDKSIEIANMLCQKYEFIQLSLIYLVSRIWNVAYFIWTYDMFNFWIRAV